MNVLAISPHPDDETLGCGGSLLKHYTDGDSLFWLIITKPYEPQWSKEIIESKDSEINRVSEAYGMEKYFRLGFPTIKLDTIPQFEMIESIRNVISSVKPELIYLVHGGDVHTDHRMVFTAAKSVLRPLYMSKIGVRRVFSYETLSSTDAAPPQPDMAFVPNVYNDITPFIERKIKIMEMYESEAQPYPLPRSSSSIRALARYRGALIGVEYAEAFILISEIQ